MAATVNIILLLVIATVHIQLSLTDHFSEDLWYISKVFPDETSKYCPNLPYYGGLVGLLGEHAFQCSVYEMNDPREIILESVADASEKYKPFYGKIDETIKKPVILLWTHRMPNKLGYIKNCPNSQCVITENRSWFNHSLTKAIYFYGTSFNIRDMPLPRSSNHLWILSHEESPKNQPIFSYNSMMQLFNITSTFRQESHLPLTTQYLTSIQQLEQNTFVKTFSQKNRYQKDEALAPIIYVHSDCGVPSDRDRLVKWMMQYIRIDSYGKCLNNKKLPPHLQNAIGGMDHQDFLELVSKYKFAIAMENGICNDYITEKLWRPLILGTVPITLGAPNIKDFAPSPKSIIDIRDFQSIKALVDYIKSVEANETAYEEYRTFKHTKSSNQKLKEILERRMWEPYFDAVGENLHRAKGNYVDHFDCYVCDVIHENMKREEAGVKVVNWQADKEHYGCPLPMEYITESDLTKLRPYSEFWYSVWMASYCNMWAFLSLSRGGREAYLPNSFQQLSKTCLIEEYWRTQDMG